MPAPGLPPGAGRLKKDEAPDGFRAVTKFTGGETLQIVFLIRSEGGIL